MSDALHFEIVGKPVSNNRVTRRFGNRSVKSSEARSYQQRVFQQSLAEAHRSEWEWPEACAVTISAYNVRLDAGNIEKNVCDGMEGAVYENDRCVIELHVVKFKDLGEERLRVTVEPRAALVKPKKKRAA